MLDPASLSPGQRRGVLAAMCLALVLVIAGVSMVTVALPEIAADLTLSQTSQTWVADIYALVLASLLLVAGALGDRFGRRGALLVGIVVFGSGALLSAFAGSGAALIATRALSGIGGALIMPGTLSTITSVFPAEERARAVGIWAGFAGAGGVLGSVVAGWMLGSWTWPTVFFVTTAAAALTFVAVIALVPATRSEEHVGLDPLGALLSAGAIAGLVLGIIEGPERGWTDPLTLSGLIASVVLGAAFVAWELRTEHPLLDPRLFRNRGFAFGSATTLFMFLALFGVFLVVFQYLQLMLGYSALKAALVFLPMSFVMIPISAAAAPLAERYGNRLIAGAGSAIAAGGLVTFGLLDVDSGIAALVGAQIILAVGVGLAMTPATNAIVSSLPASKQGVASAVNDTTREVGTALGIAILGSTFTSAYRSAIDGDLAGLPEPVAEQAREAPAIALHMAGVLGDQGFALTRAAQDAFVSGMKAGMFLGAALLASAALYTVLAAPGRSEQEAAREYSLAS